MDCLLQLQQYSIKASKDDSAMEIAKDATNGSYQPQAQQSSADDFFNFSEDENDTNITSF